MQTITRQKFNAYKAQVAQLSGAESTAESFTVEPAVQQRLETRIQDSSAFLQQVNIIGVRDIKGEKVGITVGGPIASRTDTSGSAERKPQDVKKLAAQGYECHQTNYDTAIRYATLDAWSVFPDFEARLRDSIVQRQGLDRLCIGLNGVSAASSTDLANNQLLQDVNIGWLQQIRSNAPARWMKEVAGVSPANKVEVGAGKTFKNLDSLVYQMVNDIVDPWYRDHPELRVMIGRGLHTDFVVPQIDEFRDPMQREALARLLQQSKIGGVPAIQVPFMPAHSILVTIPTNLSIYYQLSGRRRFIKENPAKNQVENFESSNDAYVVEDFGAAALVDNVTLV